MIRTRCIWLHETFSVLGISEWVATATLFERTDRTIFTRVHEVNNDLKTASPCPSVCPHGQRGYRQTDFLGISCFAFLQEFVYAFRCRLKSDEDNAVYLKNCTHLCDWFLKWGRDVFWMRYELIPKTQQRSKHLALCGISTGSMISLFLRDKYRKLGSSSFTREVQEMPCLAVEEDKYKKEGNARKAGEAVDLNMPSHAKTKRG